MLLLLTHPHSSPIVRDEPDLLPTAIEESLRLHPAGGVHRALDCRAHVLGDVELGARRVPRRQHGGLQPRPVRLPGPARYDVQP